MTKNVAWLHNSINRQMQTKLPSKRYWGRSPGLGNGRRKRTLRPKRGRACQMVRVNEIISDDAPLLDAEIWPHNFRKLTIVETVAPHAFAGM